MDILRLIYPERCDICGEIIPITRTYCACAGDEYVTVGDDFCPHCGHDAKPCLCEKAGEIALPHFTAPFIYTSLAKAALLRFKFHKRKREGNFFARRMSIRFAASFPDAEIDIVSFVPMTRKAQEERGYNQSEILARLVAKMLFCDFGRTLVKTAETENQHTLSASQRYENLKDCFAVSDEQEIKGKTILLCDDIKTTGVTLKRCCDVLFAAGAKDVYCLCAAISDYDA